MIRMVKLQIKHRSAGAVLQSDAGDGRDAISGATNVYYVATNGVDAGRGGSIDTAFNTVKYVPKTLHTNLYKPCCHFVKAGTYEETYFKSCSSPHHYRR